MLYYHSKRRSLRLFRKSDGLLLSNYVLSCELSAISMSTNGDKYVRHEKFFYVFPCICFTFRLVLGGLDGSVCILLIADENNLEETKDKIRNLPSRTNIEKNGVLSEGRRTKRAIIRFRYEHQFAVISNNDILEFALGQLREQHYIWIKLFRI